MIKNSQLLTVCIAAMSWMTPVMAFDSGSTGIDGDFLPNSNTTLTLPDSGIFNFTSLNIPAGVTVNFNPNSLNTPAIILVSGDAVIDGTIDINGIDGNTLGPAFDPVPPAGYAGGQRALPGNDGSNGRGPGGGRGGVIKNVTGSLFFCGGSGAGYTQNSPSDAAPSQCRGVVPRGLSYGSVALQPLIGGSGGGSGMNASGSALSGAAGSGGGVLLLAVSGTLTLNGEIIANGGTGETITVESSTESGLLGAGGGGSGGAVRLVATAFAGLGSVSVLGGSGGINTATSRGNASSGSFGRIRTEFETTTYTGALVPGAATSIELPSTLFFANVPTIRITRIAGQNVSQFPTGDNDVILPSDTVNPVAVEIATTQVAVGEVVKITVTPKFGTVVTVNSSPLAGLIDNATANADINLNLGASVITASVSFSVTTAQSNALLPFTNGEPVIQIALTTTPGKGSTMTLLTASGKSYLWPQNAAPLMN